MKVSHLALGGLLVACGGQAVSSGGVSDDSGTPRGSGGLVPAATGGAGASTSSGGTRATAGGTSSGGSSANGGLMTASGGSAASGGSPQTGGAASGVGGFVSSGGAFGTGGSLDAGSDGFRPISNPCKFTFAVTTVTYNGAFAPKNVGAIWIEDSGKAFVKTLRVWAGARVNLTTQWASVSGLNYVDAISSATRASEGPIDGSWNCTDISENPVPYGAYSACVEIEEDSIFPRPPPHYTCQPFDYTGAATSGGWPDQRNFVSMSWTLR